MKIRASVAALSFGSIPTIALAASTLPLSSPTGAYVCSLQYQIGIWPSPEGMMVGEVKNSILKGFRLQISKTPEIGESISDIKGVSESKKRAFAAELEALSPCGRAKQDPDPFSSLHKAACAKFHAKIYFKEKEPQTLVGGGPNAFEGVALLGPLVKNFNISQTGEFFYHEGNYGEVFTAIGKCVNP